MAASREDISEWFDEGKREKNTHMIVICDTFEYEDYPVFADGDTDCLKQYQRYSSKPLQRVMEVYDLRLDKATQMDAKTAWHLPKP